MERFMRAFLDFMSVFIWALVGAAALFLIWLLHRAIRRFAVDRIVYRREFSDDFISEGCGTELVESLWNPTPFPLFFVDVESYFFDGIEIEGAESGGGMRRLVSRFHLMPFEKITKRAGVTCKKRGQYKFSSVSIYRCGDTRWIDSEATLSVCPKITKLTENISSAHGLGDEISKQNLVYDPFRVSGIREYTAGDSFRRINFKASARVSTGTPRFVVNDNDYCSNSRYYIYQNFHVPQGEGVSYDAYEDLMEEGLKISASLVARSLESGGVCAFSANCETQSGDKLVSFPAAGGEIHKSDILHAMAAIRAADGASFSSVLSSDIARGVYSSDVFIITAVVDETMSERISLLRRFGNNVRVIKLGGDAR